MRYIYLILILFLSIPLFVTGSEIDELLADLPFSMPEIRPPEFPDRKVNIKDLGAVSGGGFLNTIVINSAIDSVSQKGGGVIIVPAGIWLTGPIVFKSNINLHLESGAIIIFSDKLEHYSLLKSTWEGLEEIRYQAPIFGKGLENIAITGDGIIDGSGDAWRPVKKFKMTENQWQTLTASGGSVDSRNIWWPSAEACNGAETVKELKSRNVKDLEAYKEAGEYLRPVMVNFVKCKNILLDGPTFQNSPAWNIHPLLSENIIIRNITVRNPWYSQNGDGLDLESCRNVVVFNCRFDVGDDAICLKSGKGKYGRLRGKPSENIVIDNCVVYHGHGGFTVGSEMSGGIRNISVRNCTFMGTDVGLRFKSTRGRGGIVENIFIENINMTNIIMEAVRFNMFYDNKAPVPEDGEEAIIAFANRPEQPVSEETPQFKKIRIKNVRCTNAGQAVLLQGLPEMTLKNVQIENISINAKKGMVCVDTEQISLENINIQTASGPVFSFFNSINVIAGNISIIEAEDPCITINGAKSKKIEFRKMNNKKENTLKIGREVPNNEVVWN